MDGGKLDAERAAPTELTRHGDRPLVCLGDDPGDVEAETGAGQLPLHGGPGCQLKVLAFTKVAGAPQRMQTRGSCPCVAS